MAAATTVVVVKTVITVVTDKRFWKIIGFIIGLIMLLIFFCAASCSTLYSSDSDDLSAAYITTEEYYEIFTESYAEQLDALISDDTDGDVDCGMIVSLMYYLNSSTDEEKSSETLEAIVNCCITTDSSGNASAIEDRNIILENVEAALSLTLSDIEKTEIISFAENVISEYPKEDLISNLDDNGEKTNIGLVNYAYNAINEDTVYICGASGDTVTFSFIYNNIDTEEENATEIYEKNKGKIAFDSIGLIKSYIWINQNAEIKKNSKISDLSIDKLLKKDIELNDINDMPQIPGIVLYSEKNNCLGIYTEDGAVISINSEELTVRKYNFNQSEWSYWFEFPGIEYAENGTYTVNGNIIKIENKEITKEAAEDEESESS